MPPLKPDRISVTCPRCGHRQLEPRTAYSTICKQCHQHFRLEEVRRLPAQPAKPQLEQRQVRCFQCGTELAVPVTAASTLCKRCGSHVDLADYRITQTVSKNFRTHGRLVIEEKGYVLNSDALVGEAVVKGRFIGKLVAEGTLEINSSANIKGSFTAGRLVIPAGHHFRWPEPLRCRGGRHRRGIGGHLAGFGHGAAASHRPVLWRGPGPQLRGRIRRRLRRHGANRRPALAGDKRKCSVLSKRKPNKPALKAEQACLVELKAQGRKAQKHRDWERQVLFLKESDEGTRLDTFFEILLKRLDLPTAGMETEDFPEWVKEHGEALSFLYHEPDLPEKCGRIRRFNEGYQKAHLIASAVSRHHDSAGSYAAFEI